MNEMKEKIMKIEMQTWSVLLDSDVVAQPLGDEFDGLAVENFELKVKLSKVVSIQIGFDFKTFKTVKSYFKLVQSQYLNLQAKFFVCFIVIDKLAILKNLKF